MAGSQARLSIQGATDEILRRVSARAAQPQSGAAGVRYGQLYAPQPNDLEQLPRQQAAFRETAEELDRRNSWMAIPAVAPAVAVLGLEGAAALAARLMGGGTAASPLVLTGRMPYRPVGDNWATRIGRQAHRDFAERVRAKPGWDAEQSVNTAKGMLRPDARAPARKVDPDKRFQLELKPNTRSGRAAGARAAKAYEQATENKTRPVFYDPKDYMWPGSPTRRR
jgi:hypothetical protein